MKKYAQFLIVLALLTGVILYVTSMEENAPANNTLNDYAAVVELFRAIKPGETIGEVISRVGDPNKTDSSTLSYDFTQLNGFPSNPIGTVGAQVFFGAEVILDASGHVGSVRFLSIDSTGSAPTSR